MPAPRDPVFRRRLISALILGPLAVVLLYLGDLAFTAWVAAFAAAMAWEWIYMSDRDAPPVAYAIACATASGTVLLAGQTNVIDALAWGAAGTLASGIERWRRGWSSEVLGVLYVSLSAALLASMRAMPDHGLQSVILLFAIVWAADSVAYLVGTWVGGPKLLPQASPKKTWSGFLAGVVAGGAAGWAAGGLFGLEASRVIPFAVIVALASVGGDLAMSIFKRSFGVKDSGTLIPGHGGVLDRVDALMLAVIAAVLVNRIWPLGWAAA
ncbi:phosphatidate cytidylyltransferase [Maricaulis sp. W15]|uniref:phosphatidate cytidylyltransferase n=1 Tax=Maricaulis sp. W15 TaxID=1772333 RepID=UPI000948E1DA|nr:phosphatidate cytidylyltransferase [Maricaulis sp. W15]OLF78064.1 phosphatidate cytidylyltransferase [Maricaulis sp. W15]